MTIEELTTQVTTMEKDLAAVTKRAEAAEAALAVAELDGEDREAYDTLSDADKATFVQADEDARSEILTKARKAIEKRNELPADIQKRFDDVQKRLDAAEAKAKEAEAKVSAAESVAKKAQDDQRMTVLAKRAETDYAGLPGTAQEKAIVLKSLEDKLSPEEQEAVFKLFKAGNECLRGQMKEVGKGASTGDGNTGESAWTTIEKKADAMAKDKNITKAKAVTEVIAAEPELYERYLEEQPKK